MNKKLFIAVVLLFFSSLLRADYSPPYSHLNTSEKNKLVKLLAKEAIPIQLDFARIVRKYRAKVELILVSKPSLGRFCRKIETLISVNKTFKKLLSIQTEFNYVALPINGTCPSEEGDYIDTGRSLLTDFVISSVLNSDHEILNEMSKTHKSIKTTTLVLAVINVIKRDGNALLRLEWKSTNSEDVLVAVIDISAQGFKILDSGVAEVL